MIKNKITIQSAVKLLNEALNIDCVAINALFGMRTSCNKKLSKHKTIQVVKVFDDFYQVGFMGILNGMFGVDENGWGCICMDVNDGEITGFRILKERIKNGSK